MSRLLQAFYCASFVRGIQASDYSEMVGVPLSSAARCEVRGQPTQSSLGTPLLVPFLELDDELRFLLSGTVPNYPQ